MCEGVCVCLSVCCFDVVYSCSINSLPHCSHVPRSMTHFITSRCYAMVAMQWRSSGGALPVRRCLEAAGPEVGGASCMPRPQERSTDDWGKPESCTCTTVDSL